uniref:Uncharacterized protein n=1 Tax=Moniliophthora roreri TaxID=221103 RepID=A0A0W0FEV7_MONRR
MTFLVFSWGPKLFGPRTMLYLGHSQQPPDV